MLEHHEHNKAVHEFDGIIENRVSSPPVYFTVLFYGLIVWAIVFMAFYLFSGWSSETEFEAKMAAHQQQQNPAAAPSPAAAPAETTAAAKQGPAATPPAGKGSEAAPAAVALSPAETDPAALFAAHCAMCHGADAGGGFGPDLTAAEYEYGKSREAIFTTISQGRANNKMPGFEGQLKREQIYALADYLLTLGPPAATAQAAPEAPGSADQATEPDEAKIDAAGLFAQRCAMCHGANGAGGGIGPDLTAADYIYGKSQDKVVESITSGRSKGMPAFGKQLQAEEISALAEYVREL